MECTVEHLDLEDLEREYYGDCPHPISWSELHSMKDLAAYWMRHGNKNEARLAHKLAHAAAWITAEAKALRQQDQHIIYPETIQ